MSHQFNPFFQYVARLLILDNDLHNCVFVEFSFSVQGKTGRGPLFDRSFDLII